MGKKKEKPLQLLEMYREEISKSANRWNEIWERGCNDPGWPDGVNMNLVRNHIIYYKRRIQEICEENGIIPPDEAYWDIPRKVSDDLYTGDRTSERYFNVTKFMSRPPVFDKGERYEPVREGQTSLFV